MMILARDEWGRKMICPSRMGEEKCQQQQRCKQ